METWAQSPDRIRILICDDYFLIREGLKSVFAREPDMEVVGEAETGEDALRLADTLAPDLVVMDILLPGIDGMEATRLIKLAHPAIAVLALTRYEDTDHILEIYRSGASAYLVKSVKADELVATIRTVLGGGVVLHRRVADAIFQGFWRTAESSHGPDQTALSAREVEVLRLLAQGLSNKEIGQELSISVRTVQNHIANIFRKLDLNDRVSAAVYAVSRGLANTDQGEPSRPAERSQRTPPS